MSAAELVDLVVTDDAGLPPELTDARIASLVRHVLASEASTGEWSIGIRFVDDPEMQRMHLAFMGLDTQTDIMTFPHDDDAWPGAGTEEHGGDLVISADRAADHAREVGWGQVEELWFLIIHGMLHLLGWDDHDDADRTRMLDRQREILEAWTTD